MVRFAFPLYTKDLWASHMKYPLNSPSPRINNGDGDPPLQGGRPQVASLWRDIQGLNSWKGLLDPINPILKAEILRYGEFAQLCYDAFDDRDYSQYYGTCKHSKRSLFHKMGFPHSGYQVTKYIYANTGALRSSFGEKAIDEGVWIGFIAVCTDPIEIERLGRRDIVIAWRGTRTAQEWIQNFKDILVPLPPTLDHVNEQKIPDPNVRIEKGFLSCYTSTDEGSKKCSRSARNIVVGEITRLLKEYKDERLSITLTGHSLGAALATLSAYDVKQTVNRQNMSIPTPVTVFAFASPRVGNATFAQRMEEIGVNVLRLVNKNDVVPSVPGLLINESMGWLSKVLNWLPWTYYHVGIQLSLQNENSPFLKPTHNLSDFHNLEVYLHLLDGYVGENKSFKSSGRDPALVNKSCNLLIGNLHIPSQWWHEANKGLVKTANGKWTWPARSPRSPDADYDPHQILGVLSCHPLEALGLKNLQPTAREIAGKYAAEARGLVLRLLAGISEALGLDSDYLNRTFGRHSQVMLTNYYPSCPEPDIKFGLPRHSDPDGITVLMQGDVSGLQVLKNGNWVSLEPLANAFVVHLADQLQVVSNGRFRSVEHQAVTNATTARISIPTFYGPSNDAFIAPAPSMVDEEHPLLYRGYKFEEFIGVLWSQGLKNKTVLDQFKIENT